MSFPRMNSFIDPPLTITIKLYCGQHTVSHELCISTERLREATCRIDSSPDGDTLSRMLGTSEREAERIVRVRLAIYEDFSRQLRKHVMEYLAVNDTINGYPRAEILAERAERRRQQEGG